VLDSHPSHDSQTQPVVDPGWQSKSLWSFAPYFEMLLPADQAATLLLALSRYRSVRISQVPSVSSLRWSSLIFPNVQSCSGLKKKKGRFRLLPFHRIAAVAGTTSPLSHAFNRLAWFTGSTENSHLLKRSIVRFRRRARKVSSFVSVYSLIWNLALVFLLIPGAAAFLNEVYPNRISTYQIRRGLSSGAGRRGPGCTSDWHIGEWLPGFLGLVSCTSRSWYLHSTVPRRHGRSTPAQCASFTTCSGPGCLPVVF